MYFIDYRFGQHQEDLINQAQDQMAFYASLIESKLATKQLCTVQLHTCVFHLPEMVRMCGPAVFRLELWIERVMQELQRTTKYRTMSTPERIATAAWLLSRALNSAAAADPTVLDMWKQVDPDLCRTRDPQDTCRPAWKSTDIWFPGPQFRRLRIRVHLSSLTKNKLLLRIRCACYLFSSPHMASNLSVCAMFIDSFCERVHRV